MSTSKKHHKHLCRFISFAIFLSSIPSLLYANDIQTSKQEPVNTVKVESIFLLPDDDLYKPIPEGLVLPQITKEVYTQWANNIRYPEYCRSNGIQGVTTIKLGLSSKGKIISASVFKSSDERLDREALRVAKNTPEIICGKFNNEPVSMPILVSFIFELNGMTKPQGKVESPYVISEMVCMARPGKK